LPYVHTMRSVPSACCTNIPEPADRRVVARNVTPRPTVERATPKEHTVRYVVEIRDAKGE
jgi:hypothetical protein